MTKVDIAHGRRSHKPKDGRRPHKPKDETAWHKSLQVAHGVLNGYTDSVVEDALWYHAHYVVPDWSRSKRMIVRINDHIFYGSKNVESVYLDHSEGE